MIEQNIVHGENAAGKLFVVVVSCLHLLYCLCGQPQHSPSSPGQESPHQRCLQWCHFTQFYCLSIWSHPRVILSSFGSQSLVRRQHKQPGSKQSYLCIQLSWSDDEHWDRTIVLFSYHTQVMDTWIEYAILLC